MNPKQELLSYISTLTPEQADKIISRLPELLAAIEEPSQPCHREQTLQTA